MDVSAGSGRAAPGANISQASVIGVIEASIRRNGVLAHYYVNDDGGADVVASPGS